MRETGDEGHPFGLSVDFYDCFDFFWRKMVFLLTHYDIDSMINLIFKIYFYVRIFYL